MCGIAGILYKDLSAQAHLGQDLIDMLDGCQHRGPDSTGFALYGNGNGDGAPRSNAQRLTLRFFVGEAEEAEAAIARVNRILDECGAKLIEGERIATNYRAVVDFEGDTRAFAYAMEHAAKLFSIGENLDIIKDVGRAHEVDEVFSVRDFEGSHGLGHVRLATESEVKPEAAHPFWATGFADVAIVHNGQITNYWKMRRSLEARDFEFRTDNDSELIAVYLAEKLAKGISLEDALARSIDELDGTFSFLVLTKDQIGYAKDRLAAKPMVLYENDDLIAIASEEVSLNRLFPGQALDTTEPPPGTSRTWSRSI